MKYEHAEQCNYLVFIGKRVKIELCTLNIDDVLNMIRMESRGCDTYYKIRAEDYFDGMESLNVEKVILKEEDEAYFENVRHVILGKTIKTCKF